MRKNRRIRWRTRQTDKERTTRGNQGIWRRWTTLRKEEGREDKRSKKGIGKGKKSGREGSDKWERREEEEVKTSRE